MSWLIPKGCRFCRNYQRAGDYMNKGAVMRLEPQANTMLVRTRDTTYSEKIFYCPMCGRRLTMKKGYRRKYSVS